MITPDRSLGLWHHSRIMTNDRLSRSGIEDGLTTRFIARRLELHDEIDSTSARAVGLAREGAPEGTLVLAEHQTEGRARLGRVWFAPKRSSLLMSLVLRPPFAPHQAQRVTMICSLAVAEAISRTSGLSAQIKWPNDILLKGRKAGGILTELGVHGERLDYVVVGMGLNVNLDVSTLPDLATPGTSLMMEAGHPLSRLKLLLAILGGIETRYVRMSGGWSPHQAWRQHLATLGQRVRVGTPDEVIVGLAEDVDEDGALLVRTKGGIVRRVFAGDVTLHGHIVT